MKDAHTDDFEKNKKRILNDIRQFHENVKELEGEEDERMKTILDLAKRYAFDANFFLEKKDLITAFGCANYAHGLLDALRKLKEKK
ncbi:DUF357 domain-containing protein [Candidatus Micrarchaeota archaeon]|nr:DUF357 domain-containing protein [Candidatus Micrarchaeota archaeon]